MNRWSQLGNKQPTDNRHYTLKISGFVVTIYKDSAKFRLSKEKAKNFSFKGQKETEAD